MTRVYLGTNTVTGQKYVGATRQALRARLAGHQKYPPNDPRPIARAIVQYGFKAFKWEVLKECSSIDEMFRVEIEMVALHKTHVDDGGYNCTKGGLGMHRFVHTDRAKSAIADANAQRPRIRVFGRGKFKFGIEDYPEIKRRRAAGERLQDIAADYNGSKNALCQFIKRYDARL